MKYPYQHGFLYVKTIVCMTRTELTCTANCSLSSNTTDPSSFTENKTPNTINSQMVTFNSTFTKKTVSQKLQALLSLVLLDFHTKTYVYFFFYFKTAQS